MTQFKVGQKWRTREGGEAIIVDIVERSTVLHFVEARVTSAATHEAFNCAGFYHHAGERHDFDLVELVPALPTRADLAEALREAAAVLSGRQQPRGPLADELSGFAGMLEAGDAV